MIDGRFAQVVAAFGGENDVAALGFDQAAVVDQGVDGAFVDSEGDLAAVLQAHGEFVGRVASAAGDLGGRGGSDGFRGADRNGCHRGSPGRDAGCRGW